MSCWEPGDLALCIKAGEWERFEDGIMTSHGPEKGKCYLVVAIAFDEDDAFLVFDLFPGEAWLAEHFRKITPPEADEFDREVIAALTGQPEQVPA